MTGLDLAIEHILGMGAVLLFGAGALLLVFRPRGAIACLVLGAACEIFPHVVINAIDAAVTNPAAGVARPVAALLAVSMFAAVVWWCAGSIGAPGLAPGPNMWTQGRNPWTRGRGARSGGEQRRASSRSPWPPGRSSRTSNRGPWNRDGDVTAGRPIWVVGNRSGNEGAAGDQGAPPPPWWGKL